MSLCVLSNGMLLTFIGIVATYDYYLNYIIELYYYRTVGSVIQSGILTRKPLRTNKKNPILKDGVFPWF